MPHNKSPGSSLDLNPTLRIFTYRNLYLRTHPSHSAPNNTVCQPARLPIPGVAHIRQLSPSQKALKEKENTSWSNLTRDEKVELYPIQFNESFAEMNRVTNEWKTGVGTALFFIGFTALVLIWEKHYVFGPIPHIFDEEWVAMQTKRILDMKVSPIQGSSDKWDYDKNERSEWKKNVIHIHNGLLHIYKDG
uniref:Cytochrome c oxidase subunit 4 n=1 Tax=Spermophilus dauricus TaxID=99837 RepID=A0A8C9P894_SPEDA